MTLRPRACAVESGCIDGREVTQGNGVDPVEREHALAGAFPIHAGHPEADIASLGDVLGDLRDGCCFEAQVHLQHHRLRQRIHGGDGAEAARLRREALRGMRGEVEALEIALEAFFDVRPENLDGHRAQPGWRAHCRLVHLRDGRCRDRRSEILVDFVPGLAESRLDLLMRFLDGKRGKPVAQRSQRIGQLWANDIGAGGKELSKLDVSGPESPNRFGEALAFFFSLGERHFVAGSAQNAKRPRQRHQFGDEPNPVPSQRRASLRQTVCILDCVDHSRVQNCRCLPINTRRR